MKTFRVQLTRLVREYCVVMVNEADEVHAKRRALKIKKGDLQPAWEAAGEIPAEDEGDWCDSSPMKTITVLSVEEVKK